MQLGTSGSPAQPFTAAWLSRAFVFVLICLALAALVALALTVGHPLAAGHALSSVSSQHALAMLPDSGCPSLILSC